MDPTGTLTLRGPALESLLEKLRGVRVAVFGDFCLDAYLILDQSVSEISVETGLATRTVRTHRYTPGGAGNVAANLAALGVGRVEAFGVTGRDLYGPRMRQVLAEHGVECSHLLSQSCAWTTHVYTKMYDGEEELNRVDFGNFNELSEEVMGRLLGELEAALPALDCVVINEQVTSGIHTSNMRAALADLVARYPEALFVTDSRHYSDEYPGTLRKLNDTEAAELCKEDASEASPAEQLFRRWQRPVFVTRGERGCVVVDGAGTHFVPGLQILSMVDTVGAGDSMLAGVAAGLAGGATPVEAAQLGNFTAAVTVAKLRVTGTAAPAEILGVGGDPDYRYRPDLARQTEGLEFLDGTDLEVIALPDPSRLRLRHAIFDHDGTVSTLRQGWETLMAPVMIRAILGRPPEEVGEAVLRRVGEAVRWFIDKTTGVQTLVQMKGLLDIIREFGYVEESQILDAAGYKEIYNRELLLMVEQRLERYRCGELAIEDYTVKNSVAFLEALRDRGIRLHLASGTDEEDVRREAEVLGYARFFDGGIYGAAGDVKREPKRMVLRTILGELGDASEVVTFGDGPVELRETVKRGGLAIGVASNEVRRWGSNPGKRTRLVEAGASLIIPDFSRKDRLLALLGT